ncbi:MAG: filamentous hemagglutinin N-terminal domain-containing protein [Nitrosomonadales bacterium]|nr:filamentous hemagglutinin N-terminal domain-containing protein [Nitrosomonadales bacterium]
MKTNRKIIFRRKLVAVAIASCFTAMSAFANPIGATVVNGQVGFATQGSTLTVTNSPNAIINWQQFSINTGETTRFIQQSAQSAVLNRVVGQDPSQLLGSLLSNGRVYLINPNGILFGQGAVIDVGGLVASTLKLADADFLAGRLNFTGGVGAGGINNQGSITTPTGGNVYLIAPDITNSGVITSPQGEILLAAGHTVNLMDTTTPNVQVTLSAPDTQAVNIGSLIARSGKVGIYGALIDQQGTVSADAAVVGDGGKIILKATGTTQVSGTLSARGGENGGDGGFIETSGAHVNIADSARIDTSASQGKTGTWLIDPLDFTIAAAGGNITGATLSTNLGLGSVVITNAAGVGNGDIFVSNLVSWSSANSLTLNAVRNINVNAAITNSGTGDINLTAGGAVAIGQNLQTAGAIAVTAIGDINQTSGLISNGLSGSVAGVSDITLSGANITLRQVQSQRHVVLNATGGVNLLGVGSGGFIDDTYFLFNLPFAFNYFGTSYNQTFITTNGLIMFGSGTGAYSDSLSGLGYYRAIAPAWNDWQLTASTGKDIHISFGASDMKVRFDVERYYYSGNTAQFEAVLNANGVIKFNYGAANNSFAGDVTIGLSNGNGYGTALASQLMSQPNFSMNYLHSTTFTPNGSGGYTETVSAGSTPLSHPGIISGSAILGQGSGQVVNALGSLNINAGGAINAPSRLAAQALNFIAHGGAVFTGDNYFSSISGTNYTSGDMVFYNTAAPLRVNALSNNGGNILLNNYGGIEVGGAVDASGNFEMTARDLISIGNGATLTVGGNLILSAVSSLPTGGALNVNGNVSAGTFTLSGGTWNQVAAVLPTFNVNDFRIAGGTFIRALGGNGSIATPYLLTDIYGVQGMGNALTSSFALANNIDASGTVNWNAGAGFSPIGSSLAQPFTGQFNGQGHTISNLVINLPATTDVGLFGVVGVGGAVNNVGLLNGTVSGGSDVGTLAGINNGNITGSYANIGTVTVGATCCSLGIGGLVGNNGGTWGSLATISNSYSSGITVRGYRSVGGLVGDNYGTISNSYSSGGTVSGTLDLGGLVGANWNTVNTSYSTNAVAAGGGGLIGYDEMGFPNNSYWDIQTSGRGTSSGTETGLTTAQMQQQATYTGWDFVNTWGISPGNYPFLLGVGGPVASPVTPPPPPLVLGAVNFGANTTNDSTTFNAFIEPIRIVDDHEDKKNEKPVCK